MRSGSVPLSHFAGRVWHVRRMLDYRNLANVLLRNELVSSHEIDLAFAAPRSPTRERSCCGWQLLGIKITVQVVVQCFLLHWRFVFAISTTATSTPTPTTTATATTAAAPTTAAATTAAATAAAATPVATTVPTPVTIAAATATTVSTLSPLVSYGFASRPVATTAAAAAARACAQAVQHAAPPSRVLGVLYLFDVHWLAVQWHAVV